MRESVARAPFFAGILALVAGAPLLSQSDHPAHVEKSVSFAILEDYDKGASLDDVARDFALFEELDIRTWRGSFGWDDYEPEPGRYDLAWLHRFAALAGSHRLTLRPYLAYTPEWAADRDGPNDDAWNDPPARPAEWERFAAAIARELRRYPHVASYEIYNEENVAQWWDGTPEEYAAALDRASRAVRANAPGALVLFGGLVFPDEEWIEQVCRDDTGRAFDVLPIHAYPETWTPSGVTAENYLDGLAGFVAAADTLCGRKAIWINETGYATVEGRTELDQARWWVRAVAAFLAEPRVEHIGVYEMRDLAAGQPAIGDAPNYHLGLIYADGRRKLAFHTVDLLTDLLDTGTLAVDDHRLSVAVLAGSPGDLHHHLFTRPDGDRVLIVWDRTSSPVVGVSVPDAASAIEYDLDGRPHARGDAAPVLSRVPLERGVPRIFRLTS
jgi:hypothetical protein